MHQKRIMCVFILFMFLGICCGWWTWKCG